MKSLLQNSSKHYTPKKRPSGHDISAAFGQDNGGAIPSNLLQIPNTESNSQYLRFCKAVGVESHPARFPQKLPEFFIKFLTEKGDIVLDIFAGSNTTGAAAESLDRNWLAFDLEQSYLAASAFRFISETTDNAATKIFQQLNSKLVITLNISQGNLKSSLAQTFQNPSFSPIQPKLPI